jgi:hypothetical protein|tara:strand:+ start:179 stop:493 length:315 start_codon:yes stop_codon:yes gene_type:complete
MKNTDNKLIAEFMGFTKDSKDLYLIDDYNLRGEDEYQATYVSEMKFHTSWDWLMPVVAKCRNESNPEDSHWEAIYYSLEECDIDVTHHAVVEFITHYNVTYITN